MTEEENRQQVGSLGMGAVLAFGGAAAYLFGVYLLAIYLSLLVIAWVIRMAARSAIALLLERSGGGLAEPVEGGADAGVRPPEAASNAA